MTERLEAIKQEVKRLLEEKAVDVVFAFRKADSPLHPQPAFFSDPADVDELVYDGLCQNNLATFISRYPAATRIGIVARGCENRAVNHLVVEHQHPRENLYVVGVPCEGVLDWRKIVSQTGEEVLAAAEVGATLTVTTPGGQQTFERRDLLHDSCLRCAHPNPVSADVVIGELLPEGDPALARTAVAHFESLPREERTAWFRKEAERCIRCYACREACPMCYCEECFVDHTTPRWTETTVSPAGMQAWHIVRAFHQAGRCVSCGSCERACPMDIKMTYLTEKLNTDMSKNYNFETGMDDKTQPPFATITLDDRSRFVV